MEITDTQYVLAEAGRRAQTTRTAGSSGTGPQARGGIHTGEVVAGVFVPYGGVNITAVSDGFLPRLD